MQKTDQTKANKSLIMKSVPWIAVFAVLAAGAMFVHTMLFYLTAKQTTCTVLKVDVSHNGSSTNTYRPTIEYTDDQGQSHVVEFAISASHYNYSVGQKVAILYDPQDPQTVRFDSFMGVWGLTAGVAIAAGVIVLVAWLSMVVQRQMWREKAIHEGKVLSDDSGHIDLPPR